VKNAPAWARDERYEMILRTMDMKSLNGSYIIKDVNKKYTTLNVSRENPPS
jgi:hypothetical protein